MKDKILSVDNLRVKYGDKTALNGLSFELNAGEVLCVIGESGSGKSTFAHSVIRVMPDTATLTGRIMLNSHSILEIDEKILESKIRGRMCGIIFQSPSARFNPIMSIEEHFNEMSVEHVGKKPEHSTITTLLKEVGLTDQILKHYPSTISGGMAQRVMIALNLMFSPSLLIADEPTTALDTINEANIINLLKKIAVEKKIGIVLITHNIDVVKRIADRIAVLYKGDLMELSTMDDLGRHPYTQHLLKMNNILSHGEALVVKHKEKSIGCKYYGSCIYGIRECKKEIPLVDDVRCIRYNENPNITRNIKRIKIEKTERRQNTDRLLEVNLKTVLINRRKILDNIEFDLMKGESVAIVGESGSGKTTLANTILGLNKYSGKITYTGTGRIAAIFQDPNKALNPNMKILDSLKEPMYLKKTLDIEKLRSILKELSLPNDDNFLKLYPKNLSGGEKQRILIGRALSIDTELIVADEATSMLDATTKTELVALLKHINISRKIAYLYITHDLKIALNLCQRIIVIKDGKIVEIFSSIDNVQAEYTNRLMKASLV